MMSFKRFKRLLVWAYLCQGTRAFVRPPPSSSSSTAPFRRLCIGSGDSTGVGKDGKQVSIEPPDDVDILDDDDLKAVVKIRAGDLVFPSKCMPSKEDIRNHEIVRKKAQSNLGLKWLNTLHENEVDRGITELEKFTKKERQQRLQHVLSQRTDRVHFVFESPSNANNVWAALRSFDSFGVQNSTVVIEQHTYDGSWRREVMGSAMGTQKWLTVNEASDTHAALTKLKEDGFRVVVSDIHESSKSVHEVDWLSQPCAIVMGNEENGVSETAKALADERFYIPMKGFAESFNLSVACAIILTVLEGKGALAPHLDPLERKKLYLIWLARTIGKNSLSILRQGAGLSVDSKSIYNTAAGFTTRP